MEESHGVLLSSKIDACQQPSAPNIQICSEPFVPFFCCFYSIICSEKVEARVSLKFSLNIIPAIDCHQLNILCYNYSHCLHTNLTLAKICLVCHCFQLKTTYNFAIELLVKKVPICILTANFTLLLGSVKHLICIPFVQCVLLYSMQDLSLAIQLILLGFFFFCCFIFSIDHDLFSPQPVFLLIHCFS